MTKKKSLTQKAKEKDDAIKDMDEVKDLKRQITYRDKIIRTLERRLDELRKTKWRFPTIKKGRETKGAFYRVVLPDLHGCKMDPKAVASLFEDIKVINPSEIVMLGDMLDCGGFLAQHWTLGYVAELDYTFEQDVDATNMFLDRLHDSAPKAEQYYLEGNHEARITRWVISASLRQKTTAEYLMRLHSPPSVLGLEKRNIKYIPRDFRQDNSRSRGLLHLGKCAFTHGRRIGVNATRNTLKDHGTNVVHGHIHRAEQSTDSTSSAGTISAWCPGCLCQLVPMYEHGRDLTSWSHGYGFQLCLSNGDFLHINIPIIEGRSYLADFRSLLR